jgi:adenine C2-methylase RlmN of 23S rRNA A2503 and tRNA A37
MNTDLILSFQAVEEDDEDDVVYTSTEVGCKSNQYFCKTASNFLSKPYNVVLYQGIVV